VAGSISAWHKTTVRKIITAKKAIQLSKTIEKQNKKIILVGGCFDILHAGHIKFLEEAKNKADILILLLESDKNIKKIKGSKRPINTQKNRSIVLSALSSVDYIIQLKGMTKGEFYDKLIVQIKPAYIAITVGDKNIKKREEQCKLTNAQLVRIKNFGGLSSSNYIESI
jgi:D-beta-D-heptose 7-phosphate kinase/D-beta-D-heptose 1-phosphate adenosyltransferase